MSPLFRWMEQKRQASVVGVYASLHMALLLALNLPREPSFAQHVNHRTFPPKTAWSKTHQEKESRLSAWPSVAHTGKLSYLAGTCLSQTIRSLLRQNDASSS